VLTDAERTAGPVGKAGEDSHGLALQAKIVLACAAWKDNKAVAAELRVVERPLARSPTIAT
jgi:hypothetical protein